MTRTKVKVEKAKLVEAIKARRVEAETEFKARKEKAKAEAETYEMRVLMVLHKAIEAVENGKTLTFSSYKKGKKRHYVNLPDTPNEVSDKFDGGRYDRDIKILEMSPDEVISISTEDFERYVK